MIAADGTAEGGADGSRSVERRTDGWTRGRADGRRSTGRRDNSRTDEQLQMAPQRDELTDLRPTTFETMDGQLALPGDGRAMRGNW